MLSHLLTTLAGKSDVALALYVKHGAAAIPANYNIYKRICTDCFSSPKPLQYATYAQLRDMLCGLVWVCLVSTDQFLMHLG